jgi:cysteine desulfurase
VTATQTVYLDHNASAPLRPEALEAVLPHLHSVGNSASVHTYGQQAERAVRQAREQLASLIDCHPNELIFTSGATEANNLALHLASENTHIVTSAVEHPAVLETATALRTASGVGRHLMLGVDAEGKLDLQALANVLEAGQVGLVSVMVANNETGVVFDLGPVAELTHAAGALFHTDATQAVGRIPLSLRDLPADMLSLSAHKFGGLQGAGALFVRRGAPVAHRPLLFGGGHERGWRAGTVNVPGVVAMGAAAAACAANMADEAGRIRELRDLLEREITASVGDAWVNCGSARRLPGTSSITFRGAPADAVMAAMPDIAVSDGSACHSGAPTPSHVLLALGMSRDDADSTLRFSLGYTTSADDVKKAITATVAAVRSVRALLVSEQHRPIPQEPGTIGATSGFVSANRGTAQ